MNDILSMNNNTFIIEIKSLYNSSWQGILTWVDTGDKVSFRSTLELIRLLDSAVNDRE